MENVKVIFFVSEDGWNLTKTSVNLKDVYTIEAYDFDNCLINMHDKKQYTAIGPIQFVKIEEGI